MLLSFGRKGNKNVAHKQHFYKKLLFGRNIYEYLALKCI